MKKKILLATILIFTALIVPSASFADIDWIPQVTIGSGFQAGATTTIDGSTIANYIKAIYDYLIGIVGLTAAVALMVGGVIWLTSGGSSERVSQAKSWISGSLTGLVLALLSYLILQTINPKLVEFEPLSVTTIKPTSLGCCQYTSKSGTQRAIDTSDVECYLILTDPSRVEKPIATTTQKHIDGLSGVAQYIKNEGRVFDAELNALGGKCVKMGYGLWTAAYHPLVDGRKTIGKTTEDGFNNIDGSATYRCFFTQEEFNKNDNYGAMLRETWKNACNGRGDGSKCKNRVTGALSPSCYCYGGVPHVGKGEEGQPCGNEGGSICVPDRKIDGISICDNKDHWGRDCGTGLKCCEASGIKWSVYDGI